jgi:hypothetical protein
VHRESRTFGLERQNTAERGQIPRKDGGSSQKVMPIAAGPEPDTQESPPAPSANGGWIGQARGISTVRCCLLGDVTGADSIACLPATPQGEMRERDKPFRQDGEALPAWMTDAAADPDALVSIIVALPESPSVANDGLRVTKRARPR